MSTTNDTPTTDENRVLERPPKLSKAELRNQFRTLTSFQQSILRIVAGMGTPKGLAIKEKLEDYYAKEVNHGRLYPNLDTLVENGFVVKGERDKRTNYYELTDDAKTVVREEVTNDYEVVEGDSAGAEEQDA
jgi:DNA-binding PadR family transcriptional regulator